METLRRQQPNFPTSRGRAPWDLHEPEGGRGRLSKASGVPEAYREDTAGALSPVSPHCGPAGTVLAASDADASGASTRPAPQGRGRAVPSGRDASARFGIVLGSERFDKATAPVAPKYCKAQSLKPEQALPQWMPAGMPLVCQSQSPRPDEHQPGWRDLGTAPAQQSLNFRRDDDSCTWELHGVPAVHEGRSRSPFLRGSVQKALPVISKEAEDVSKEPADAIVYEHMGESSAWSPTSDALPTLCPIVVPRRLQHSSTPPLPPGLPRSPRSPSASLSSPFSMPSSPVCQPRALQPSSLPRPPLGSPTNEESSSVHSTKPSRNPGSGSSRSLRTKKPPGSGLSRLSQVHSDAVQSGLEEAKKLPARLDKATSAPVPLDPAEADLPSPAPPSGWVSSSKPAPLRRMASTVENEAAAPGSPRTLGLAALVRWQERQGSKLNALLQRKGAQAGAEEPKDPTDPLSQQPKLPTIGRVSSATVASLGSWTKDEGRQGPLGGVEAAGDGSSWGASGAGPTPGAPDLHARVLGAHMTAGKHRPAGSDSNLGRFFTPKTKRLVPGSLGGEGESLGGYRFKQGQDVAQLLAIQRHQGAAKQVEGPLAPIKGPYGKPRLHHAMHSADLSEDAGPSGPAITPIGLKEVVFGSGSMDLGVQSFQARRVGRMRFDEYVLEKEYEDVYRFYVMHSEKLGSGQFGVIRKCKEIATGQIYACKTLEKKRIQCAEDAEDIRREVACLTLLKGHPTVVRLKDAFEDKDEIHLVMELCRGGDLFDRVKTRGQLAEADAARLCRALVEALLHCHCLGVMHRDIKLENILMTRPDSDSDIKLVDFGVATFFQPGCQLTEMNGTREYMAPEVLRESYGPKADIWSAGIVLYIVLSGIQPFWASSREGLDESILNKEPSFKSKRWAQVSDEAKDVVRKMLTKDPSKRPSATAILSHPWFQKMAAV